MSLTISSDSTLVVDLMSSSGDIFILCDELDSSPLLRDPRADAVTTSICSFDKSTYEIKYLKGNDAKGGESNSFSSAQAAKGSLFYGEKVEESWLPPLCWGDKSRELFCADACTMSPLELVIIVDGILSLLSNRMAQQNELCTAVREILGGEEELVRRGETVLRETLNSQ
ncbi:hypothetical protein TSAR_008159, partial [Trichomalopsis sarcophagae]